MVNFIPAYQGKFRTDNQVAYCKCSKDEYNRSDKYRSPVGVKKRIEIFHTYIKVGNYSDTLQFSEVKSLPQVCANMQQRSAEHLKNYKSC